MTKELPPENKIEGKLERKDQSIRDRIEKMPSASFNSEEELINYLISFNIPVESWGQGRAKTISHLFTEIREGETVLVQSGKELVRQIEFASVNVFFQDGNDAYRLVEDHQKFKDGRIRQRKPSGSLSEKMKSGENSLAVAKRAVIEELGIGSEIQISGDKQIEEMEESPSYPELTTRYIKHVFTVELKADQFSRAGYTENQEDKTTFFIWSKVDS